MRDRVLFVDDDTNLLASIQRNLRRSYDCTTAVDAGKALELLNHEPPYSIVVADMRMTGQNGIELLEQTREMHPDTIRIMLTGFADMSTTLDAINKARVFSFLQKPFDSSALQEVLQSAVEEHRRIQKMHLDSLTDPLTGLYNRRYIKREFSRLLELSRRNDLEFAVLFSDVNNFKMINDQKGHGVGDEVLMSLSTLFRDTARGSDIVCRYGGDEFLVLMESADSSHALKLIKRLDASVSKIKLKSDANTRISVSHGYAGFPQDGDDIASLLQIADSRMYENKSAAH